MSTTAVGVAAIIIIAAAITLCYALEGKAHPELEDHDWYRG